MNTLLTTLLRTLLLGSIFTYICLVIYTILIKCKVKIESLVDVRVLCDFLIPILYTCMAPYIIIYDNIETKIMFFDITMYLLVKYSNTLSTLTPRIVFSIGSFLWIMEIYVYSSEDINNIYLIFNPSSTSMLINICIYIAIFTIFIVDSVLMLVDNLGIPTTDISYTYLFNRKIFFKSISIIFLSTYYVALLAIF